MLAAIPLSARAEFTKRATISSGVDALDALLDGGFPTGRLTSIQADPGCGGLRLVVCALAFQTSERARPTAAAVIDGPQSVGRIHPPGLHSAGVRLDRLLIAAPADLAKTVRAAEEILRHGSFPLVVIRGLLASAPHSRRLMLAAEAGGSAGLLLVEGLRRTPPPSCAVRLQIKRCEQGGERTGEGGGEVGDGAHGRFLVRRSKGRGIGGGAQSVSVLLVRRSASTTPDSAEEVRWGV